MPTRKYPYIGINFDFSGSGNKNRFRVFIAYRSHYPTLTLGKNLLRRTALEMARTALRNNKGEITGITDFTK